MDYNVTGQCGRLTRDAVLTIASTGLALCKFSIAVNGWKKDDVSFFNVTLFGKSAEAIAKYLTKGKQVIVQGSLVQSRWTKDGQNFSNVGINAVNVQLLGGGTSQTNAPDEAPPVDFDTQIPF